MYFTSVRNFSNLQNLKTWYSKLVKKKPPEPPYNHIIQIGDPRLRQVTEPVEKELITSKEIQFIINRMKYVYSKYNCVGLAAPQIGVPLSIILLGITEDQMKCYSKEEITAKEINKHPLQVVINPSVKIIDYNKIRFSESCGSIKGFCADVPRAYSIEVTGLDEKAIEQKFTLSGWLARIMQHETDHLEGKLYTDLMDRKSLSCSCWHEVNEHGGRVLLPYNDK